MLRAAAYASDTTHSSNNMDHNAVAVAKESPIPEAIAT